MYFEEQSNELEVELFLLENNLLGIICLAQSHVT